MFVTLVIWSCSLYWLENKKLRKNIKYIERTEIYALLRPKHVFIPIRNSRKSYKWLGASPFFVCIFVSEICDSSQCFVGESHSLSVHCVLMFITLVIWSCSWWFIPEPETFQKLENNILMFASEPKFLYFCVRNIYFFFTPTRKLENQEN